MLELKKYAQSYLVIQPFLNVRCFGAPELCSGLKELRLVRQTPLKK
ncbi:MAG: hypothetical protein JZD41_02985 [Thermoproteus sp.]|nr:hypothetical protein [Thermoproteus sp.]